MNKEHKKSGIINLLIFLIVISLLLTLSCSDDKSSNKKDRRRPGNYSGKKQKAGIIEVERRDITQILEENGELEPVTSAEIKSRISGSVVNIFCQEGDYVKKGSIIAKIVPDLYQTRTMTGLQNSLDKSKIELKNARLDYERKMELYGKGFISEKEMTDAEDTFLKAKMDHNSAKQEYELFRGEVGVSKSINQIKQLSIISPLSGIAISKDVEEGELVTGESTTRSGSLLFEIADLTRLIVKVDVNEVDIYKLKKGDKVNISIPANPSGKYTGYIKRIAPYAESKNGVKVFPTEIQISEKDNRLKPGMSAVVKIVLTARKNVITVPVTALFIDKGGEYVLMPSEGKPKQVRVERGINDAQYVEIKSGINEGERIFSDIPFDLLMKKKGFMPTGQIRKP